MLCTLQDSLFSRTGLVLYIYLFESKIDPENYRLEILPMNIHSYFR